MNDILSIDNFSFSYDGKEKSDEYTIRLNKLRLNHNSMLAITGVSGCGKSTLLECLGLLRDGFNADSYRLGGCEITQLSTKDKLKYRSAFVGYMPQTGGLIPYLSIKDNIKLQIEVSIKARKKLTHMNFDTKGLLEKSLDNLEDFDLGNCINRYPHELSIGQRQRVVFFKTICHEPSLVLIDEPTSSLDPEHGQMLFSNIVQKCSNSSMGAVIVTHDLNLVRENAIKALDYQKLGSNQGEFVFKD